MPPLRIKEDAIASVPIYLSVPGASCEPDIDLRIAKQRKRNACDSIGYVQMADAALSEVLRLLSLAAELADRAARVSSTPSSRIQGDIEFKKLLSNVHQVIDKTALNGAPVFTTTSRSVAEGGCTSIDLSAEVRSGDAAFALELSTSAQTLITISGAEAARLGISTTLASVRAMQASLGNSLQQLITLSGFLGIQLENATAVQTQTRDATLAEEVVNLTKFQILNQTNTSALRRTSQASRKLLTLLRKLPADRLECLGRPSEA